MIFKKKLIQLHRESIKHNQSIPAHISFCEQREVSSFNELSDFVDDVKNRFDWDGFQMVAHEEGSSKFLMVAA